MKFDQKAFGQRVKNLRKQRKLTQEQLTAILNISVDHLSKIELGKRGISIDLLLDISEALNISTDFLLKGTAPVSMQMNTLLDQMKGILARMENIRANSL